MAGLRCPICDRWLVADRTGAGGALPDSVHCRGCGTDVPFAALRERQDLPDPDGDGDPADDLLAVTGERRRGVGGPRPPVRSSVGLPLLITAVVVLAIGGFLVLALALAAG